MKIRAMKTTNKKLQIGIGIAVAVMAVMAPARAVIYDDFSSGNMDKWSIAANANSTWAINSGILTLGPTASPAYSTATYTSTKTDFEFSRTLAQPLQLQLTMPASAFGSAVSSQYQSMYFGFKDTSGNTLVANIAFAVGSTTWRAQTHFNAGLISEQWVVAGGAPATQAGDIMALTWTSDATNNLRIDQIRGGSTIGSYALGTFASGLGSTGSIYFAYGGTTGSTSPNSFVKMDSIGVVPEPATWALVAFSLTTMVVLRRRGQSRSM